MNFFRKHPLFFGVSILMGSNLMFAFAGQETQGILKSTFFVIFTYLFLYSILVLVRPKITMLVVAPLLVIIPFELIHLWMYHTPPSLGVIDASLEFNSNEIWEILLGYFWLVGVWCGFILIYFWLWRQIPVKYQLKRKFRIWIWCSFIVLNLLVYGREVYLSQKIRYTDDFQMALVDGKDQFFLKYEKIFPAGIFIKLDKIREQHQKISGREDALKNFTFGAKQDSAMPELQTVVLVIGESARGDHFGINGYLRSNTPELQKREVLSFRNVLSNANLTSISIPMILSRSTAVHQQLFYEEKSLISLFKEVGFKTFWISNQESIHSEVSFISREADVRMDLRNRFDYDGNYDTNILPVLDSILSHESSSKKLIVIHTMGSHFRYNYRYPTNFDQYQPSLSGTSDYSVVLGRSNKEVLINSYDNTILFTDHVLSKFIDRLKTQPGAVSFTYTSDHGESLYEEDLILHGTPGTPPWAQLSVPLIFWFSTDFDSTKTTILKQHINKKATLESIFHTLPDVWSVRYGTREPGGSLADTSYAEPDFVDVRTVNESTVRIPFPTLVE